MATKTQIIQEFYDAFNALDMDRMVAHYHPQVQFEDPAFGVLQGEEVSAMWRMLASSQKDKGMQVKCTSAVDNGHLVDATWEARYVFTSTRRKVHNRIKAQFTFEGDLIIRHIDQFDLYRWSRQALGLSGWLIGWTPFFKNKLQKQTRSRLTQFQQKNQSSQIKD